MAKARPYATEADLVRDFLAQLNRKNGDGSKWTVYAETADWDLLMVHKDGFQLGLEAKLSLNAKVIDQALDQQHSTWRTQGPDYRGVLVPSAGLQRHLTRICKAVGIGIVTVEPMERGVYRSFGLPSESYGPDWPNWLPAERCPLPDYIPDVEAGHASPVKLTEWKIKAIRLMIILERRGYVTRADMKAIQISPSRWTDAYQGFLAKSEHGYVRSETTPDLKAQHPVNYAQIEAEFDQWGRLMAPDLFADPVANLFGEIANA
ncbi:hypothetical protein [Rhizorhapis suberifaciens]|uniref:Uncharacterized protein n=1 Tax=Rhizorhapis suberifaciens TaxID=13656 RepID=A0A840HY09_9SPHN|nr:hypothetical protein [Rhizorhapis suberifaciens]MBB4642326.1 hypothetical protein [Rhizorhapis suberifaciens]